MAQVLSTDLTFDHGSPHYGGRFAQYIGLVPTTGTGEPYSYGLLHDGYSVIGDRKAAFYSSVGTSSDVYSVMTRDVIASGSIHTAVFRLHSVSGAAKISSDFNEWSLFARVQDGTLAGSGTTAVRYSDVTAYQFRMYLDGALMKFQVRKLVSGTPTVLGLTIPVSAADLDLASGTSLGLVLIVSGTSSPVSITTYGYLASASGAPLSLVNIHTGALAISDVSSPITADGRAGFGMGTARSFSVGTGIDTCKLFAVNTALNAALWRDEWVRHAQLSTLAVGPDSLSTSGRSLQAWFNHDQFGIGAPYLTRDSSNERVSLSVGSSTNEAIFCTCLRPADSTTVQHRKATFELRNVAHTSNGAGIGVYMRPGSGLESATGELGFTTVQGYAAICKHTTSGDVYTVSMYRYDTGYANAKIAEYSVSAPGTGAEPFPLGAEFDFSLEAYPTDNQGGYPDASVTLKCYIDDVQVVLESVTGAPAGISVNAAGTVTDAGSTRVMGGPGEAIFHAGHTGADGIWIDDWTQATLHTEGSDPPEQPTAPFDDEGTASTSLDTVVTPAWSVDVEYDATPISIQFESGARYTAPRHTDSVGALLARRTYTLTSPPLTLAERDAVHDFFLARGGTEDAFNFTDPRTGETVKVHFVEPSMPANKLAPGTHKVSLVLEELI